LNHCTYHPKKPTFSFSSNIGTYPCCNKETKRFTTAFCKVEGCAARPHIPDESKMTSFQKSELKKLISKGEDCIEPFIMDPSKPTLVTLLKEYLATD